VQSDPRLGRAPGPFGRYVFVCLGVAFATWIELIFARTHAAPFSLFAFCIAIALSAALGGLGPGLVALLLSAFAIDFFIIVPGGLLDFQTSTDALVFVAFCAGWLAYCVVSERAARRLERDRDMYFNAERAAAQADRIAQVTAALSHARSPSAVVEATVQEPLHALKADAALMVLFGEDGGAAEIARAVGYRPEEREARESNLLGGKTPAADAIGRGAPVVIESPRSYGSEYPELHRAETPAAFKAIAAVPLLVGSRVVAVVQYEFRQPRAFTTDDREYLFMLGPRAAQALDRTWQHESALRARTDAETLRARAHEELAERETIESALRASEARYRALAARTTRMHDLAAALSEAVTPQAVARAVVEQGRIAVGATAGEVMLLADDDMCFEMLYGDAPDRGERQRRFPAESGFCATQAAESRRPVFVGSFNELQEQFWRSASIAADGGYVSSATLPLLVEGTAIGVLAFNFTVPVNFDAEYQALLVSVAQHCAQALDRARLYDSAQRARAEAENANRLKDEFVSIVSHELRTPLNAMVGWTSMLQNGSLDSTTSARALQSIHDNATRQAKLIEELLDFSKLKSGRMTLDRDEIDLHDLLRGIVESIIPSVAAKGLDLEVPSVPSLRIYGDPRRLEQVFFNLLGNAMKFTPRGGRVSVAVRAVDRFAEIRVSDTGAGIDPAFLPHVFDRFRQADSHAARAYDGVGLGLSIAKELVEAHDGRITAESAGRGRGSTFVVSLPIASPDEAVRGVEPTSGTSAGSVVH
jgi:K+-sensing histidine kinase KdpD